MGRAGLADESIADSGSYDVFPATQSTETVNLNSYITGPLETSIASYSRHLRVVWENLHSAWGRPWDCLHCDQIQPWQPQICEASHSQLIKEKLILCQHLTAEIIKVSDCNWGHTSDYTATISVTKINKWRSHTGGSTLGADTDQSSESSAQRHLGIHLCCQFERQRECNPAIVAI